MHFEFLIIFSKHLFTMTLNLCIMKYQNGSKLSKLLFEEPIFQVQFIRTQCSLIVTKLIIEGEMHDGEIEKGTRERGRWTCKPGRRNKKRWFITHICQLKFTIDVAIALFIIQSLLEFWIAIVYMHLSAHSYTPQTLFGRCVVGYCLFFGNNVNNKR
jgi:hypothetical protein